MIIITKKCFLIADRVESVSLVESQEEDICEIKAERLRRTKRVKGKKTKRVKRKVGRPYLTRYNISIHYVPTANPNGGGRDSLRECSIQTYEKSVANELYTQIVQQYREQNPDQLYLDRIAETFLSGMAGKDEEVETND